MYLEDLEEQKLRLKEKSQLDEAEEIIRKYFNELKGMINDIIGASGGMVSLDNKSEEFLVKLYIRGNMLKFTRGAKSIEIKSGEYEHDGGMITSEIVGYVVPGEKRSKIKRLGRLHDGSNFDENTINHYMRETFKNIIKIEELEESEESED
jgi:hypothetical protein